MPRSRKSEMTTRARVVLDTLAGVMAKKMTAYIFFDSADISRMSQRIHSNVKVAHPSQVLY